MRRRFLIPWDFFCARFGKAGGLATFASRFGRDGGEGETERKGGRKKIPLPLAKRKRFLTFATRFGRSR
ncbi:hypothetical protein GCM10023188_09150 [Pontibacter saemangeumensis]|uniref:Uncharacterized protein n=1 Tax=Pontibacter saemangeumensis TaxID=1084525 RepID=A0ABP8LDV5_9BACT